MYNALVSSNFSPRLCPVQFWHCHGVSYLNYNIYLKIIDTAKQNLHPFLGIYSYLLMLNIHAKLRFVLIHPLGAHRLYYKGGETYN